MRKPKYWWIQERHNPQLGVYYVGRGQISQSQAMAFESASLYGSNYMLRFESEYDYNAKLKALKDAGENVS